MVWQKSKSHLTEVKEGYFVHQRFALSYALTCLQAASMAFVHAIIPALFPTAASDKIKNLAAIRRADHIHYQKD